MAEQLTDEQILDLDAGTAPAEATPSSEALQPDSAAEAEPTQPETETAHSETETPVSEKQPETVEKPEPEAETLEEQFPGGRDQAADVISKAGELDTMDHALQAGNASDMAQVVWSAYEQAGSERFPDMVQLALNLLEDRAPAQFDALVNSYIREKFDADGVWDALEYVYSAANQNPQSVPDLLNRFANYLTRFGLGPYNANTEATSLQEFSKAADETITDYLNTDIQRVLPPGFKAAPPELQTKFIQQVHAQIQKWAKGDPHLAEGVAAAFSKSGLTRKNGIKAVNLLISKAQSVIPQAVKLMLRQPEYGALKFAPPRNINDQEDTLTQDLANRLSDKDVMGWRGKIQRPKNAAPRPQKISRADARRMDFRKLLESAIEVEQQ